MSAKNLDELIESTDNIVELLRRNGANYRGKIPVIPREVTNWIDEQRAVIETCALSDLSFHLNTVHIEGPDAVRLLNDLSVNSFEEFEIGRAKQLVFCNQNGDIMDDGPYLRLDEDKFWGTIHVGWLEYCVETGDYDVSATFHAPNHAKGRDPNEFIYQIQGPKTYQIIAKLTDDFPEDIPFFSFEDITLAGKEIRAFGHGMSTEPGLEIHGPFEYAEEIKEALLEAGREHGIRHLGSKAYLTHSVRLGWIPPGPPPVYDLPEMKGYRQWLSTDSLEATYSIEGSFDSTDIRDYYMSPVELGYARLIKFDHDFIGRDALEAEVEAPKRRLVSLFWADEDVIGVYASLFREGADYKFMDLPRLAWARMQFDTVLKDGEVVGLSHTRCYERDVRNMVSLGVIDVEYSEPGTEVTLLWGEGHDSPNPKHESSIQKEITATVRPAPYTRDKRKEPS